jgi:hypothetical protein
MDSVNAVIPCAGFVGFFALMFGYLALMRWFRHRETMAAIQQGVAPPQAVKQHNGNGKGLLIGGIGVLVFGLVMILVLGAFVSFVGVGAQGSGWPFLLLVPGLLVLFCGVGVIILYLVLKPAKEDRNVELEVKVEE